MKMMNRTVLVTRPQPEGDMLCEAISALGGKAISLPTIIFAPPEQPPIDINITHLDWLIFVSKESVRQALKHGIIDRLRDQPHVKCAAVGASTARLLQSLHIHTISPRDWSSEGLLAQDEFLQVTGKRIAIVRGEGGREHLEKVLEERGAESVSLILYQRKMPDVDMRPYFDSLKSDKINVIVCTSGTGIRNLVQLFGEDYWPYLRKVPLLVVSERLKMLAEYLGFQTICQSRNASTDAIIASIDPSEKSV